MCACLKRVSAGSILILYLMTNSGCLPLLVGAAAGAGGVAYVRGTLVKNVDNPVAQVHKAAAGACKSLKISVQYDDLNEHSARIKGTLDDGKKVDINVAALTERSSKIQIRVGLFGDETKSQMILNVIQKKL